MFIHLHIGHVVSCAVLQDVVRNKEPVFFSIVGNIKKMSTILCFGDSTPVSPLVYVTCIVRILCSVVWQKIPSNVSSWMYVSRQLYVQWFANHARQMPHRECAFSPLPCRCWNLNMQQTSVLSMTQFPSQPTQLAAHFSVTHQRTHDMYAREMLNNSMFFCNDKHHSYRC